ncbi:MAG: hypothetical protein AB1744_07700 [Candidatus Zixiibacteriota bacterium]
MKLLDNIWLRVIAVATGLLLWFHVATEKEYQYRLTLPVTEITLGQGLTLSEPLTDSVEVSVSASGKQLLRRSWREKGLRLQATDLSAGRPIINLTSANTSLVGGNAVSLEEIITPTSLQLNIDYISEAEVEVVPDLVVSAAAGFVVKRVSPPDPPVVTLIGARSKVRMLPSVSTEPKELDGLRDNLMLTLAVQPPQGYDIVVQPESVTVSLEIVAAKTLVLDSLPVIVRNAPPNTSVRIEPPSIEVELAGPPDQVDMLDAGAFIAFVDYLERDSDGVGQVVIECPDQFKVKRSSVTSVRIIEQ